MKLCVIVTLICCVSVFSYGQNTEVDSSNVNQSSQHLLKSSEQRVDSIRVVFYSRSDSLTKTFKSRLALIDSTEHALKTKFDSLATAPTSAKILSGPGLDSIRMKWMNKVDSLKAAGHPSAKIIAGLDSVNKLRNDTLGELNRKMQSLKEKAGGKLKSLDVPPELSAKFSDVTGNIEGFQIPETLDLPSLNTGNNDLSGGPGNLDSQLPATDVGLGGVDELQSINGVEGLTKNAGEYSGDIQHLSKGNISDLKELPEAAEAKAVEMSGVNEVKDQTEGLNEYKDMASQMQNPDSLKEFAVQEVKQVAVNHFAGKEEQLKQAMETLSKYKSKYSSLTSIRDITKRPPNEMKGKPLIERIIPGIGIQVQKKGEDVLVDFNAYAGYRFTGRITAGAGWNQRVAYTIDRGKFNSAARIYGPRAFGEYKLWKGFSPRAELEIMNTNVPPLTRTQTADPLSRQWVWGAFLGVKKEYRFIKKVKGTAMVMMRMYNPAHKSPYGDVVNVRFGFEFPFVKGKQLEE